MHEIGLVAKAVADLDTDGVSGALVEVGPGADRAAVELAWSQAVTGTSLAEIPVEFVEVGHLLRCFACATEYRGDTISPCPECGGPGLAIEEAPDVAIRLRHEVPD